MADLPNRDEVISVLRRLIEAFEEILAQARKDIEDSPEAFSNQGIWKLEAVSDIYAEAFNRNHVIDLIDHVETLKEHKVKTIVISGGTFEAAQEWKVKASCPFDVLVDEGGKLFKAFGLGRSYVRGWSMNTATFFAEWRAAGIPSITDDFEPRDMDSLRDGGDFILNREGKIIFARFTSTPMDRPSIDTVLTAVKELV